MTTIDIIELRRQEETREANRNGDEVGMQILPDISGLDEAIQEQLNSFVCCTGRRPTFVILGPAQWDVIKRAVRRHYPLFCGFHIDMLVYGDWSEVRVTHGGTPCHFLPREVRNGAGRPAPAPYWDPHHNHFIGVGGT